MPDALLLHSTGICQQLTFNGPSWSINAEAFMYLAAPLIFMIARGRMGPWVQLGMWAAYVVASMRVSDYFDWTSQGGVLRAVPAFLFGTLLYFNQDALKRVPAPVILGVAAMVTFLVGTAFRLSDWALMALVHVIAAAAVAADVQERSSTIQKAAPFGQLTYSIYMIHQFILVLVGTFVGQRILGLSGAPFALAVLGAVILTLVVSLASYHWFETPLRRLIVRRLVRRRAPAVQA